MDRLAPDTAAELDAILDRSLHLDGPLLPILHDIQAAFGHIPEAAIPVIASALNVTAAEVHGVISFYHDFRKAPAGKHMVKICRAEACQASGATAITDRVLSKLGLGWHDTSANGAVTIEPVYCLGLCACGPAAMVDGKVVGRLDETRMETVLKELGA